MHVAGVTHKSLPMRGEWIEIFNQYFLLKNRWSLPMRGEWIEIFSVNACGINLTPSLPMRGEWIEIELGGIII